MYSDGSILDRETLSNQLSLQLSQGNSLERTIPKFRWQKVYDSKACEKNPWDGGSAACFAELLRTSKNLRTSAYIRLYRRNSQLPIAQQRWRSLSSPKQTIWQAEFARAAKEELAKQAEARKARRRRCMACRDATWFYLMFVSRRTQITKSSRQLGFVPTKIQSCTLFANIANCCTNTSIPIPAKTNLLSLLPTFSNLMCFVFPNIFLCLPLIQEEMMSALAETSEALLLSAMESVESHGHVGKRDAVKPNAREGSCLAVVSWLGCWGLQRRKATCRPTSGQRAFLGRRDWEVNIFPFYFANRIVKQ